jgi:GTP cyclohydrolase II
MASNKVTSKAYRYISNINFSISFEINNKHDNQIENFKIEIEIPFNPRISSYKGRTCKMQSLKLEEIINQDLNDFKNCPNRENCDQCEYTTCVKCVAIADFPTKFGHFQIVGFVNNKDKKEHIAIIKGNINEKSGVLTRVHSACLTGDALGSLRCDCGSQLAHSLNTIENEGLGVILYMQQEGRGIGLLNKLRAYALQDNGFDTYDANIALGFGPDQRDYEVAGEMLTKLGVKTIRLLTNNPEKINQIAEFIPVVERIPLELPVSKYNIKYMETKKQRFGHYLKIHSRKDDKSKYL